MMCVKLAHQLHRINSGEIIVSCPHKLRLYNITIKNNNMKHLL